MRWTRLVVCALLSACAGSPKGGTAQVSVAAHDGPMSLAGPRCQGGACTCRRVDDQGRSMEAADTEEGPIAPGQKRFEIRTGRGLNPLEITIAGRGTLRKGTDSPAPACAYIDLPPGRHTLRIHATASNPDAGQEPSLFVSEYSATLKSWYDTFRFRCGGDGVCSHGHMLQWMEQVKAQPRGLFDPCGSVRIEGVKWDGQRSVGTTLGEVDVELALVVYKFPPRFPHGNKTCKGPALAAEPINEQPTAAP